jgi:hypothetical protein
MPPIIKALIGFACGMVEGPAAIGHDGVLALAHNLEASIP